MKQILLEKYYLQENASYSTSKKYFLNEIY